MAINGEDKMEKKMFSAKMNLVISKTLWHSKHAQRSYIFFFFSRIPRK